MSGSPAPGWYDDQHGSMRWWDGHAWTAQVRAAPVPDPMARLASGTSVVPASTRRSAPRVLAAANLPLVLVAVVFAGVVSVLAYLAGPALLGGTAATDAAPPVALAWPTSSAPETPTTVPAKPTPKTKPKPKPKRWHPRGWTMFSPTIAVHFLPVADNRCEAGTSCASLLVASKTSCRVLTLRATTGIAVSNPTSLTDGDRVMRASARNVRAGRPVRLRLAVIGFSNSYLLTDVVCRR